MSRARPGDRAVKHRLRREGGLRWRGVSIERYKQPVAGEDWSGVTRQVLYAGSRGAAMRFDLRYFELAAGYRSSLERHRHAHVVVALRGEGGVRLGERWHRLRPLDACYIAPNEPHQLRNAGRAPFGFLCVVDAERDIGRPVAVARKRQVTRRG